MLRRAAEDHHHTTEDVENYLRVALYVLGTHDLDPATHDATLAAVLGLLASKQMVYEQMQPSALGILR
jgi:hypothetical protein